MRGGWWAAAIRRSAAGPRRSRRPATWPWRATRGGGPRGSPRRGAGPCSRCRRSSAPGGCSAATARITCDFSPLQGATIEEDLAQARLHRERDGGAAGRRRADRSPRRRARPARGACCGCWARAPTRTTRCGRCAWCGFAAELGFAPDPETERLTRAAAPRLSEPSPGAGVRGAAAAGGRRRLPGGPRAGGAAGRARRRAARADRAGGHRAEPLPPPRRLRPHARGAARS